MRKHIVFLVIVLVCCLSGCSQDIPSNTGQEVEQGASQYSEDMDDSDTTVVETESEVQGEEYLYGQNSSSRITYPGTSYTWQEITMIIPEEWQDKYIIKEFENGFSIIQKSSYEKDENMGFLCSVNRDKNYYTDLPGSSLVAYSDDGEFYYLTFPTDVTFYVEDETISAEYMNMSEKLEWLVGSITIDRDDVFYDANQYILVNSSISPLEDYQLMNLSDNQLWIARNEIFARHGRIFKNAYLNSYFNSCSWYKPVEGKTEVADSELSQIEKDNLRMIIAAEQKFKEEHPYPQQCATNTELIFHLMGNNERYRVFYETSVDEEWNYTSVLKINGTSYDLFNYVSLQDPVQDVFYITDISEDVEGYSSNDGLEIVILDNGPSDDPITHFFKYDGDLVYVGYVPGFPFKDYGNGIKDKDQATGLNGFTYQNGVYGTVTTDLIETAYIEKYYWYNKNTWKISEMKTGGLYYYKWNQPHELYVELPVYFYMDENSPTITMMPQEEVYFIKTDNKEWIFIRSKDGIEGYIHVKDGKILNIDLPAEEVFSNLSFFG